MYVCTYVSWERSQKAHVRDMYVCYKGGNSTLLNHMNTSCVQAVLMHIQTFECFKLFSCAGMQPLTVMFATDMVFFVRSGQNIKPSLLSRATSDMPTKPSRDSGTWKFLFCSSIATLMTPLTAAASKNTPVAEGEKREVETKKYVRSC